MRGRSRSLADGWLPMRRLSCVSGKGKRMGRDLGSSGSENQRDLGSIPHQAISITFPKARPAFASPPSTREHPRPSRHDVDRQLTVCKGDGVCPLSSVLSWGVGSLLSSRVRSSFPSKSTGNGLYYYRRPTSLHQHSPCMLHAAVARHWRRDEGGKFDVLFPEAQARRCLA